MLDLGCGRGEALAVFGAARTARRAASMPTTDGRALPRAGPDGRAGRPARGARGGAGGSLGAIVSLPRHRAPAAGGAGSTGAPRLARAAAGRRVDPGDAESALAWWSRRATSGWIRRTCGRCIPRPCARSTAARFRSRSSGWTCSPFPDAERLPELDIAALPAELRPFGHQVTRLRDRLDELLFGYQDYGLIGEKI